LGRREEGMMIAKEAPHSQHNERTNMSTIELDTLEEMEREFYADNRMDISNLLGMVIDTREDITRMEQRMNNAEENVDSLTKKLSLVIEMVEDADNLEKLQKSITRIKSDIIMSGVKL
jgi:hypothetical protein